MFIVRVDGVPRAKRKGAESTGVKGDDRAIHKLVLLDTRLEIQD